MTAQNPENHPLDAPQPPARLPAPQNDGPPGAVPAHLAGLAERARDYARRSKSLNTERAYAADWRHYTTWARRQNLDALPPDPQVIGLYMGSSQNLPKILR